MDDLKKEIRELSKRIEELEKLLSVLLQPYNLTLDAIRNTTELAGNYLTILKLYLQHGKISPEVLVPELKDAIAREMLAVLFEKRQANITEIAEELKRRRGKASRATVRAKLKILIDAGYVSMVEGRGKRYMISQELVNKWLKMLGLVK